MRAAPPLTLSPALLSTRHTPKPHAFCAAGQPEAPRAHQLGARRGGRGGKGARHRAGGRVFSSSQCLWAPAACTHLALGRAKVFALVGWFLRRARGGGGGGGSPAEVCVHGQRSGVGRGGLPFLLATPSSLHARWPPPPLPPATPPTTHPLPGMVIYAIIPQVIDKIDAGFHGLALTLVPVPESGYPGGRVGPGRIPWGWWW